MNPTQLHARFTLIVVVMTIAAMAVLEPFIGIRALGCLGLLGLLGLAPLYFRRRPGRAVMDERDLLILRRSSQLGHVILWGLSAPLVMLTPMLFAPSRTLPVTTLQLGYWLVVMLVISAQALATLIQYGREPQETAP